MTDTLYIRPLDAADAAAFKEIRLCAIADSPTAVWPTLEEEAKRGLDEVEARIRKSATQVVFGAFSGHELVGIAGLRREPLAQVAHKAVLWGVFVAPAHRKEGVARSLFSQALEHARATGILQIQLCVNAGNTRAKNLYRSLGFESLGVEPRAMRVGDQFHDEEHMVLRVDAQDA
ncbi:MAG: GNAT family N-acetyltransferase [Massilia sp.]